MSAKSLGSVVLVPATVDQFLLLGVRTRPCTSRVSSVRAVLSGTVLLVQPQSVVLELTLLRGI